MNAILSWVISMFLSSPAKLQEILLGLLNNVNVTGNPGLTFAVEFAKGGVGSDSAMQALFDWVKGDEAEATKLLGTLPPDADIQGTLTAIAAKQSTATMFVETVYAVIGDENLLCATNPNGLNDYLRLRAEAIEDEADTKIDPATIIALVMAIIQIVQKWRDRKNA